MDVQNFEFGNKYKKHFVIKYNQQDVFFTISTIPTNTYLIVNQSDLQYNELVANDYGFINVNIHNSSDQNNKLSIYRLSEDKITYDDYEIKELFLLNNEISQIVLSQLIHLENLNISNNKIKYLRLNNNTQLKTLVVTKNQIENIDLYNNLQLQQIDFNHNNLTSIDLTKNNKLQQASLMNNNLEKVFLSNSIVKLNLSYNCLKKLEINSNSQLKYLDVSYNQSLSQLTINNDVIQYIYYNGCSSLKNIIINDKNVCLDYDGLVGYFSFDNNIDSVTKKTFLNNGAVFQNGLKSHCLCFEDVNSCVYFPNHFTTNNKEQFSYTFWLNFDLYYGYDNYYGYEYGYMDYDFSFDILNQHLFESEQINFKIGVSHNSNDYKSIRLFCNINKNQNTYQCNSELFQPNGWMFFAVCVDLQGEQEQPQSVVKIYINGILNKQNKFSDVIGMFETENIGNIILYKYDFTQGNRYINKFCIDQLGFYNKCIDDNKIQQLYNHGNGFTFLIKDSQKQQLLIKNRFLNQQFDIFNPLEQIILSGATDKISDLNGVYLLNDVKKIGYDRIWSKQNQYFLRSSNFGSWQFVNTKGEIIVQSYSPFDSYFNYILNPKQIATWWLIQSDQGYPVSINLTLQ